MIIIYFQFHYEINLFHSYWIITFICFFYLSKICFLLLSFSKIFSFFNSIFSCFFSFQITNIHFYFLLFNVFPKFVFFKKENLFCSNNEKNVLPIFKNSKKIFEKQKMYIYSSQFCLNENIYSIFGMFFVILFFWEHSVVKICFMKVLLNSMFLFPIFYVNYHQIFSSKKNWNKNMQSLRILGK